MMKDQLVLYPIILFFLIPFFNTLSSQNVDSLERVLENEITSEQRIDALSKLAKGYLITNTDKGLSFIEQARELDDLTEKERSHFDLLEGMAYRNKGEYNKSIELLRKRIKWLESSKSENAKAVSYLELGLSEGFNFESENAMLHLNIADSLYRLKNDKRGQAQSINGMGGVLRRNEQAEKGIEKYEMALALFQEIDDKKNIADIYNNLASAYGQLKQFEKSASYFKKQEKLDLELGNESGLGTLYENMGTLEGMQKNFKKAIQYYKKSLTYHDKFGNKKNKANVLLMMGYTMSFLDDNKGALEKIEESMNVAKAAELKIILPRTYKALSDIYAKQNNYKAAYEYYKEHKKANENLSDENVRKQITALDAKYEKEKKEREILALNSENEKKDIRNFWMMIGLITALLLASIIFYFLRQRQKNLQLLKEKNNIISDSLAEKNILLKEIHHRVKNNLQVISSLLNLQSKNVEDSKVIDAINEGRSRVHSMALIHQSLYKKENLVGIDVKAYFEKLSSRLFDTYKVDHNLITLKTDIEDIQLDVDTMIPLGLMMNELVTNALKYAYVNQGKGTLWISLKEEDNQLILNVKDDGVGIADLASIRNNDSLGYQLIDAFLAKMDGEMEVQSNNGTSVLLKMKEYKLAV